MCMNLLRKGSVATAYLCRFAAAFGLSVALAGTLALAQTPTAETSKLTGSEHRFACIYEQLPTGVKLRFELAVRVGQDASEEVVGGAREDAFKALIRRCGFTPDAAFMARATRYYVARASRSIAAIEADRAGVNIEALAAAFLQAGKPDEMRALAEELMTLSPEAAAKGKSGAYVANAIKAFETAVAPLSDEQKKFAAMFVTTEVLRLGLEDGAKPPSP